MSTRSVAEAMAAYKNPVRWFCRVCNKPCDPNDTVNWKWDDVTWMHKHPSPLGWIDAKQRVREVGD